MTMFRMHTDSGRFSHLFLCICLGFVLLAVMIAAVSLGPVSIPFNQVVEIIFRHVFKGPVGEWSLALDQIVWVFRLPRTLLAAIVGAGLAAAGGALQAVARNPLADPYIFGISSGASATAVAFLTLGGVGASSLSLAGAAFLGALVTTILVYLLAQQGGRISPMRLVLSGVAMGYILSAVTSFLVLRSSKPEGGLTTVLHWLAGSLGSARWNHVGIPALVTALCVGYLLLHARRLNTLLSGDETAVSLGVDVDRFRLQLFVVTSLLVGVLVAASGCIGFVGLIIPHLARMLVGANHSKMMPVAALLGGVIMVAVDLVGRVALSPMELPAGIVTAAMGGPFFLWLLRRRMGKS